jgi:triacylglycerol lipase
MSGLRFIFVHGLSGWGSYDKPYRRMPYWGMRGGDLIAFLREQGYDAYAASVAPTGSAWDRACELYAQLAGTRTDYGEAHSARFRHGRFGRDFSGCPLIPAWKDGARLVLLGHSFGGATVRLFSELLAHGDGEEREKTSPEELSPLFAGEGEDHLHSVVTLASPMNGTTAYDLFEDESFDPGSVKVPWWSGGLARMMALGTRPRRDGRDERDWADWDMHVDNALALNERMRALESVYYFSVPCSCTRRQPDGSWKPEIRRTEPLFVMRALQIGQYSGVTKGGTVVGDAWRENDGLVNTLSAAFPLGEERLPLDPERPGKGVWNVFPTYDGDHMALQGGLMRRHDVREFYLGLLRMIENA